MKLLCRLLISTSIFLNGGGLALAQVGSAPGVLTASVGPSLGSVANPSAFSFGGASSPATPSPTPGAVSQSGVMGFQAWKQAQIDEAKQTLERVQATTSASISSSMRATGSDGSKVQKIVRNDQHMRQSQINVEIAQELTVNDYFLIYLSQFKSKDAFAEAAKRLSPEELADLLMSYQRYVSRADQIDAPASGLLTGYGAGPSPAPTGRVVAPGSAARAQTPAKTPHPHL